jgi:hypothetical protein
MKELILFLLGLPGIIFIWLELIPIVKFIKFAFNLKRLKPFDCESCLAFWSCLIYSMSNGFIFEQYIFTIGGGVLLTYIVFNKLL